MLLRITLQGLVMFAVWILTLAGLLETRAEAAFWKPVTAEELALKRPRLDPEAGVEVLFREAEIDDTAADATTTHTYVRLKVFTARGVAALDRIEIAEPRDTLVRTVAARVIRPDGTVVEVDDEAIFARVMLRRGSVRRRVKTFSIPALEPGCIVEYQWEEISESTLAGRQLYFQDRFPAWRVRFRIKPFPYEDRGYQLKTAGFRYRIPTILQPDNSGFYNFEQTDVPALREEPWMPPDDMVQPWMVLYFLRERQSPQQYWAETARAVERTTARLTRPTAALREQAEEVLKTSPPVADDADKLRRLARFCRDEITNTSATLAHDVAAGLSPPPDRAAHAEATLLERSGSAEEINLLFLALARAAGFEGRVALVTDRSKRMFREPLPARFMLPDRVAAIRLEGGWRFYDPGKRFVAAGNLAWENEGVTALICDRRRHEFVQTPRTPRGESRISRTARLTIDPAGEARGTVVAVYRGHCAVEARHELAEASPDQRAALIYAQEVQRLPGLEMTEVTVAQAMDSDAPLVVSYRIRLPHYAAPAGDHVVFPLAYFQQGQPAAFVASTREHVIYQPYEFLEDELVEFTLPAGYALADTRAPAAFALPPTLEFRASLSADDHASRWSYRRVVSQGGMLFPASTYRLIKQAFDTLHRRDAQVVLARRDSSGTIYRPEPVAEPAAPGAGAAGSP